MGFGSVDEDELFKIVRNLTEDNIINAIEYINKNGINGSRKSITHYIDYKNQKFPLKYVLEIANNKIKNNSIKIGPNESLNPDSWGAGAAMLKLFGESNNFKIITPYSEEGRKKIEKLRDNFIDYAINNGLQADNTPKKYTALKAKNNIAEVHNINKNYARFAVIVKYDALPPSLQKNVKKIPKNYKWTLDGELYIKNEKSFSEAKEILKFLINNLKEEISTTIEKSDEKKIKPINISLNQILYGPPGTGKTYNTILKAMSIIDGCEYKNVEDEKYDELKIRFDELRNEHQIEFVTFHQSYSYEEFVEGIKPYISEWGSDNEDCVKYIGQDGIFKDICKRAQTTTKIETDFDKIYEKFTTDNKNLEKPLIISTRNGSEFRIKINSKNNIKIYTGESFDKNTVGVITKEYLKNEILINGRKCYVEGILDYLKEQYKLKIIQEKETKPYILIIDEINRGDVSKIFGELITLIEEDKRIDNKYQMTTTLPYSKEAFGVPNNLFIIGTMNMADRSIALLDTALRRRFDFEEIMPKPEILNNQNVEGIDLQKLLTNINKRICEKYDRDHQIGHSYLMNIKNKEQLERAYKNKILPLLNEYFYNDTKTVAEILNCSENDLEDYVIALDKAQCNKND